MKTYIATLSHDMGNFTLQVRAMSKDRAAHLITQAEGCPRSAIIRITTIYRNRILHTFDAWIRQPGEPLFNLQNAWK